MIIYLFGFFIVNFHRHILYISCLVCFSIAGSIPHDATVSAAMLLVATYNITLSLLSSSSKQSPLTVNKPPGGGQLVDKIQCYLSEYSKFAQLSLCHALLAKLPVPVITCLEMEDKPLLLALFPIICQLFKRQVKYYDVCINIFSMYHITDLSMDVRSITIILSGIIEHQDFISFCSFLCL